MSKNQSQIVYGPNKSSANPQNSQSAHYSQKSVKSLIKFVSIFPNAQNAICFIYASENSVPTKFFSIFPAVENQIEPFGLYYNEFLINEKKTIMIGLNHSFINLANDSDKEKLTHKHLILMYLMRKIQSIKFVLCFDKSSISESAFLTVKNTFNRLSSILDFQNHQGYGKSFMILISHPQTQDAQQLEEVSEAKFKQSINEKEFFKDSTFASQIIKDIFQINKNKKHKKRFLRFENEFPQNEVEARRKSFENIIEHTKPLTLKSKFKISDNFLIALRDKSKDQKINEQKSGLCNLFVIWQETFKELIKLITQKLTKGKNQFNSFRSNQTFMISKSTSKYKLDQQPIIDHSVKKCLSQAYQISRFLSSLMEFLQQNIKQFENFSTKYEESRRLKFLRTQLGKLLRIFYDCELLSSKNEEKVIHDFFMVFDELIEVLSQIEDPSDKEFSFFIQKQLMTKPICNLISIRKLFQNVAKTFNHMMAIEFSKIEKGELVHLQCLEPFINKIKSKIEQLNKLELDRSKFKNERVSKTIEKYEQEMVKINFRKLTGKPLTQILFIVKNLRCESDLLKNRLLIDFLPNVCLEYIDQYRIDAPLQIKQIIINLFEFDVRNNWRKISKIYQDEIDRILHEAKKLPRQLSEQEKQFILSFAQFVIKLGYQEKLRQKAYIIGEIDQNLWKKIMCQALLSNCSKTQLKFIKTDPKLKGVPCSAEEVKQHQNAMSLALDSIDKLERFFLKDSFSCKNKQKEEEQLLDI